MPTIPLLRALLITMSLVLGMSPGDTCPMCWDKTSPLHVSLWVSPLLLCC